jgi:hypothetical protein
VVTNSAVAPGSEQAASRALTELDTEYDIGVVLAFLNTCDAETGDDLLDDPERWRRWCADRGLGTPTGTDEAREVRDTLRSSVVRGEASEALSSLTWPIRVTLQGGLPVLSGTDAVGTILAAAVHLVTHADWDRIKICPAEDCLWAFYDRSRNRSRTWCSMRVCGNREKARSWRERHTPVQTG